MAKNRLDDLRNHLFATGLKDGSVDVGRARAIANVSQTIINSMTLEVRAANAINAMGAGTNFAFIDSAQLVAPENAPRLPAPKPNGGAAPGEGIHAADPLHGARKTEPRGR